MRKYQTTILPHSFGEGETGLRWRKPIAIEQEPDAAKAQVRVQRFGVGDSPAMAKAALGEAAKDWVKVYFGSYVVRPGLSSNSRGSREDITAVLMLGVDQDADGPRGVASLGTQPHRPDLADPTRQPAGLLCL